MCSPGTLSIVALRIVVAEAKLRQVPPEPGLMFTRYIPTWALPMLSIIGWVSVFDWSTNQSQPFKVFNHLGELPGGPVVKTHFHCRGSRV